MKQKYKVGWILFLLMASCSLLDSCNIEEQKVERVSEYGDIVDHFQYKSHEYLRFGIDNNRSIVHNPDCKCLNKHIIPVDNDKN